jgi:hypothetical protein
MCDSANRLTGADRRFEEQARGYAVGEPQVAHHFPPPAGEPTKKRETAQTPNVAAIIAVPNCQFRGGTTQIESTGDDHWPLSRPRQYLYVFRSAGNEAKVIRFGEC